MSKQPTNFSKKFEVRLHPTFDSYRHHNDARVQSNPTLPPSSRRFFSSGNDLLLSSRRARSLSLDNEGAYTEGGRVTLPGSCLTSWRRSRGWDTCLLLRASMIQNNNKRSRTFAEDDAFEMQGMRTEQREREREIEDGKVIQLWVRCCQRGRFIPGCRME